VRRIENAPTFVCEGCGDTVARHRVIRRGGGSRGFLRGIRFCSRSCAMRARTTEKKGSIHHSGYRYISMGKRGSVRAEHRVVMEQVLGRPLLSVETVHHLNGDRADNRPENLELWSSRHAKGQKVEDLVAFAKEILALYGDAKSDIQPTVEAQYEPLANCPNGNYYPLST
jgi:hypothetical protein